MHKAKIQALDFFKRVEDICTSCPKCHKRVKNTYEGGIIYLSCPDNHFKVFLNKANLYLKYPGKKYEEQMIVFYEMMIEESIAESENNILNWIKQICPRCNQKLCADKCLNCS